MTTNPTAEPEPIYDDHEWISDDEAAAAELAAEAHADDLAPGCVCGHDLATHIEEPGAAPGSCLGQHPRWGSRSDDEVPF